MRKLFALISFTLITVISAKISEKRYVSMPVLFHFDDYDRCMLYGEEALYCGLTFQMYPLNPKITSEVWKTVEEISSEPTNYRHDLLRHWICVSEISPNATGKDELEVTQALNAFYNQKYKPMGIRGEIIKMRCETGNSPRAADIYDKLYVCVCFLCVMTVLCATICEGCHKSKETSSLSIRKNWQRLINVSLPTKDMQALRCIQGFRFYNCVGVIMGHTTTLYMSGPITNTFLVDQAFKKDSFQLKVGFTYSMQIFFMISSFLLTYQFFCEHGKADKVSPRYFIARFIRRYIRLTASVAFLVFFAGTRMVHLSRGPVWDAYVGEESRNCREYWWTNLLYINNYIDHYRMVCFGHGWYLAVSTQFYVLNLLVVWLMWKNQNKIPVILGSLTFAHVTYLFWIIFRNNWHNAFVGSAEFLYFGNYRKSKFYQLVYTSFNGNMAGLIGGLFFGYLFYKCRNRQLITKKIHVVVWWILTFGLYFGIVMVDSLFIDNSRWFNGIYGSLKRLIIIFSAGLMIMGMSQGHGGLIKRLCEMPTIYVLGRLTYSAYIVHPLIQLVQIGAKRTPNFLEIHGLFVQVITDIVSAFLGGLLLTLFIEMPVMELQKMIATKKRTIKPESVMLQDDDIKNK